VLYFQPSADITEWVLKGLQVATPTTAKTPETARPNNPGAPIRK